MLFLQAVNFIYTMNLDRQKKLLYPEYSSVINISGTTLMSSIFKALATTHKFIKLKIEIETLCLQV